MIGYYQVTYLKAVVVKVGVLKYISSVRKLRKISQKLSVRRSEWVKNTFQFTDDFIKNYNEDSNTRYFLDRGGQYQKKKKKTLKSQ